MSSDIERWAPPNDATAFESLCLDLWQEIWQNSGAQQCLHTRNCTQAKSL